MPDAWTRSRDEDMERLRLYRQAWEAYYGDFPLPLKIRPRPGQPAVDDNIALGWASEIVDTGVAYLFSDDLRFDVFDPTAPGEQTPDLTAAQQWLDQVWRHNRKMTTLQKLGTNGAVCGHAFVRIRPTVTATGAAFRTNPHAIRLQVLDPANVDVKWDQEDVERAVRYDVEWLAVDDYDPAGYLRRHQIVHDDDTGTWLMLDQRRPVGGGEWATVGEAVWPFPWAPIVDCQNMTMPNEYYGQPDLDPVVIRMIRAAIARASDLARTHRLHAHPQLYATGMTPQQAAQISLGIDQLAVLPNPEARLEMLEMKPMAASADLKFVHWLKEQVREYARIPEVATGRLTDVGALSGVALSILFQPLIAKTETKRRTYGELLDHLNYRLLSLAGWERYEVRVQWPDLIPGDPKAETETAILKQTLGVSGQTLLSELGYDAAVESTRTATATEDAVRALLAGGPGAGL